MFQILRECGCKNKGEKKKKDVMLLSQVHGLQILLFSTQELFAFRIIILDAVSVLPQPRRALFLTSVHAEWSLFHAAFPLFHTTSCYVNGLSYWASWPPFPHLSPLYSRT